MLLEESSPGGCFDAKPGQPPAGESAATGQVNVPLLNVSKLEKKNTLTHIPHNCIIITQNLRSADSGIIVRSFWVRSDFVISVFYFVIVFLLLCYCVFPLLF